MHIYIYIYIWDNIEQYFIIKVRNLSHLLQLDENNRVSAIKAGAARNCGTEWSLSLIEDPGAAFPMLKEINKEALERLYFLTALILAATSRSLSVVRTVSKQNRWCDQESFLTLCQSAPKLAHVQRTWRRSYYQVAKRDKVRPGSWFLTSFSWSRSSFLVSECCEDQNSVNIGVFSLVQLMVCSLLCEGVKLWAVYLVNNVKLTIGVSVSVHVGWRPVQVVPCLSSNGSWDRLQPPCDPELAKVGTESGWMDGWKVV